MYLYGVCCIQPLLFLCVCKAGEEGVQEENGKKSDDDDDDDDKDENINGSASEDGDTMMIESPVKKFALVERMSTVDNRYDNIFHCFLIVVLTGSVLYVR